MSSPGVPRAALSSRTRGRTPGLSPRLRASPVGSRSRSAAALAPPGAAGQNRTRSAARGRASAVPGAGTDSRGPCTEPQGRRHPKIALWTTAASLCNFTFWAWHGWPQEQSISPNSSWGRALLLLSCPQPVETLIQLNLNGRLEMPEQRSEAAAQSSPQGVGKQGLSRVSMDHFCSLSLEHNEAPQQGLCHAGPRFDVAAPGPWQGCATAHQGDCTTAQSSTMPAPAPAQLPGLLSPDPAQPNKRHKCCFVLQPRAGSHRPHNPHKGS